MAFLPDEKIREIAESVAGNGGNTEEILEGVSELLVNQNIYLEDLTQQQVDSILNLINSSAQNIINNNNANTQAILDAIDSSIQPPPLPEITNVVVVGFGLEDLSNTTQYLREIPGFSVFRLMEPHLLSDVIDLSNIDQLWFLNTHREPQSNEDTELIKNFIVSGGFLYINFDFYSARNRNFKQYWKEFFENELGSGNLNVPSTPRSYPNNQLFDVNQSHPISNIITPLNAIEHLPGDYQPFNAIGNGDPIAFDSGGDNRPVGIAFDKGHLMNAPNSRAIIYGNSDNFTGWKEFVINVAHWAKT